MNNKRNTLSKRLKKLREREGISQYKLAENLNLSRGLLSNYEQGTREPDYDTLIFISDYYNVSIDYLLGLTGIKNRITAESEKESVKSIYKDINNLSEVSLNDLINYIELLKIRDKK